MPRTGSAADLAQVERERQHRLIVLDRPRHARVILRGKLARLDETADQRAIAADGGRRLPGRGGGIGIAPVDPRVVAGRLAAASDRPCPRFSAVSSPAVCAGPFHLLVRRVDRQQRAGAVVDRDACGAPSTDRTCQVM